MMKISFEFFFPIIAIIIMSCSLAVIFTKSTIHSIIYLVLSFLTCSVFLFMIECEFFALLFLLNAYTIADDIEIGFLNKIPLYLFGFLY